MSTTARLNRLLYRDGDNCATIRETQGFQDHHCPLTHENPIQDGGTVKDDQCERGTAGE